MIDVMYFAWVRERIGVPREQVDTQAQTVAELVQELVAREARYAAAFADTSASGWRKTRSPKLETAITPYPIMASHAAGTWIYMILTVSPCW